KRRGRARLIAALDRHVRQAAAEIPRQPGVMLDRREIARLAVARPRPREGHEAALRRDHVAGPQRGIVRDADRRETESILAVAGALRHQPLAIEESVLDVGITFPIGSDRVGDLAAVKDGGLAGRAEGVAQLAGHRLRLDLDREMAAVAQAHAIAALARRVSIPAFEERGVSRTAVAVAPRRGCVAVVTMTGNSKIE